MALVYFRTAGPFIEDFPRFRISVRIIAEFAVSFPPK